MSNEFTVSEAGKVLENANLIKKYHGNLIYDYTEYPTKGIWTEEFGHDQYKDAIYDWFLNNKKNFYFFMYTQLSVNSFVISVYAVRR